MSYPLLADSLDLEYWGVEDTKVTTKSKQRFAPITARGKPAIFKLSAEPLLCPWGVDKFQDLDSGRITLTLIVEDPGLVESLEKIDGWVQRRGEAMKIKGNYKPIVTSNEKFGNKKIKVKVQLDVAKFWRPDKNPYEFLPELKGSKVDCVVQFAKIWTGVDQWGCTVELKHALVEESIDELNRGIMDKRVTKLE